MKKKLLAFVLAALLINLVCITSAPANPKVDKEMQFASRVKAAILKLGTGPQSRVEVKLREGTKLKGYIAEAGENHFVVVDEKSGAAREVPYPQVKQVKGNNLSSGAWIAITAGVIIGTVLLLAIALRGS